MHADLPATSLIDLKSPIVCRCPYCGRDVREAQRLSYPTGAVGRFAPVYRCSCRRHIGAPVEICQGHVLRGGTL